VFFDHTQRKVTVMTAALKAANPVVGRRIRTISVYPSAINLLTQVRLRYEDGELQALADNIASLGLLELSGAAYLTKSELRSFLARHNLAWNTDHQVSAMWQHDKNLYLVGCFGHRRILAHVLLWERGCSACQDVYGLEMPGTCWSRHPETLEPDGTMELRATRNLTWVEAMLRQAAENTYVPVAPEREAKLWEQLWGDMKAANPALSIKAFAACVGKPAPIVSERLRFRLLPDEIRMAVERKEIPWGIATELLRLKTAGFNDAKLIYWMRYAWSMKLTVTKFRQTVSNLNDPTILDVTMFFFAEEEARQDALDTAIRAIPLSALETEHAALFRRLEAIRCGVLGDDEAALHHPEVLQALATAKRAHAELTRATVRASKRPAAALLVAVAG
jgi:hypothetical protein